MFSVVKLGINYPHSLFEILKPQEFQKQTQ